jgi:hypothetical protein
MSLYRLVCGAEPAEEGNECPLQLTCHNAGTHDYRVPNGIDIAEPEVELFHSLYPLSIR